MSTVSSRTELRAKASVRSRHGYGRSPLHYAVARNDITIVSMLISAKAEVNASSCIGYTALHYAADEENAAVIKFLLAPGADPQPKR